MAAGSPRRFAPDAFFSTPAVTYRVHPVSTALSAACLALSHGDARSARLKRREEEFDPDVAPNRRERVTSREHPCVQRRRIAADMSANVAVRLVSETVSPSSPVEKILTTIVVTLHRRRI